MNDNVILGEGQRVNGSAQLLVNHVLTINGDYQQGGGASLLFGVNNYLATNGDINSYNGYGRLVVSGSANITSGSNVGLMGNGQYALAQGQRYVVIRANSDGTGYNADKLDYWAENYTGLLTGNTVTHGSTSDLVVTLGDCNGDYKPIGYATTSNAVSSLNGLFNNGGTDSSLLNLFNADTAVGNTAEANRAGAQHSPAAIASASAQAAALPAMLVLDVLAQRGEAIRLAGAGSGISTGENDDGPVGYPLSMGTRWTRLTPFAALTYSKLGQDGYTESGGNGAGLRVDNTTVTSLKSDLALKLDHRFKMSDGEIQPFIQGGWRHEYHDDALQSVASFSADSTGASSFVARGSKPVIDTGVFSAGGLLWALVTSA